MESLIDRCILRLAALSGSKQNILGTLLATAIWYALPISRQNTGIIVFTAVLSILAYLVTLVIQHTQNVLQETQNADTKAIHAKLDELIHAVENARNELIGIEAQDVQAIESMRQRTQ